MPFFKARPLAFLKNQTFKRNSSLFSSPSPSFSFSSTSSFSSSSLLSSYPFHSTFSSFQSSSSIPTPSSISLPLSFLSSSSSFSRTLKTTPTTFLPSSFSNRSPLLFITKRSFTIAKPPQPDESQFLSNQDVSVNELRKMIQSNRTAMDTGDILLVDVRNPEETALGIIPTAITIPLSELKDALALPNMQFKLMYQGEKPSRESGNLVFYCKSGKRSSTAMEIAKSLGFKKVRNFSGSYLAWLEKEEELKRKESEASQPTNGSSSTSQ